MPATRPAETALIVPVPEAEPVVGPWRATLDTAASWGVPAHITVLYPFLPLAEVDAQVLDTLAGIVARTPRIDLTLTRVDWFGDIAAWLAPEPAEPFRALTMAVWRAFPQAPPYRGLHDEVIPHLTVGDNRPMTALTAAAAAVAGQLPIRARVAAVRLIAGTPVPGGWRTVREFPLGR